MATVELKSISKLFGEDFFIPSYQRGYRWTNVQVKELLEDLYDFAAKRRSDDNSYYCLQPVIVKKHGDKWELVDGQQRLTALWLMSALYYCSNKNFIFDLQREKYSMEYEEKVIFTTLFEDINSFVEDENSTMLQIREKFHDKKGSIDSRNLIESMNFIASYKYKNKPAGGILAKIFEEIDNIKIIWYVLDADEDAIQTFTNINANKIDLTNAELIKAVLLNSEEEGSENIIQSIANQWEEIERGLNDNAFWNFIIDRKRNEYSTRIDYLFEIWCARKGLKFDDNENDDRYATFRFVNEQLMSGSTAKEIWKGIQEIYETLLDWYDDYYLYHTIGLIITKGKNKDKRREDINTIIDLYRIYAESSKSKFRTVIIEEIKSRYFSKGAPFNEFTLEQIVNDLGELSYDDMPKVRDVLLLYNIAMLINANNVYERFPFELYKDESWDIEHINPQTPKEGIIEEKKAWMESYEELLLQRNDLEMNQSLEEVLDKIRVCKENNMEDFDEVSKIISDFLEIDENDNDSISNLVLLDAKTNRGYKNDCFSKKRKRILEIERTCNSDGAKYIPIGTKWVFLKGYENAKSLIVWGADDMQDYVNDMAHSIFRMLGGNENEQ